MLGLELEPHNVVNSTKGGVGKEVNLPVGEISSELRARCRKGLLL
jgi:hypothetical protein